MNMLKQASSIWKNAPLLMAQILICSKPNLLANFPTLMLHFQWSLFHFHLSISGYLGLVVLVCHLLHTRVRKRKREREREGKGERERGRENSYCKWIRCWCYTYTGWKGMWKRTRKLMGIEPMLWVVIAQWLEHWWLKPATWVRFPYSSQFFSTFPFQPMYTM